MSQDTPAHPPVAAPAASPTPPASASASAPLPSLPAPTAWPPRPAGAAPAPGARPGSAADPDAWSQRRAPAAPAARRAATAPPVWDDERAHAAHLERLLGQCRRLARPAALLLVRVLPVPPEALPALVPLLGQRLRARVRASDAVAQLGRDHFSVLLYDIDDRFSAAVRQRLLGQLAAPCALPDGALLRPALRIGRALPGRDGRHADELLRAATLSAG